MKKILKTLVILIAIAVIYITYIRISYINNNEHEYSESNDNYITTYDLLGVWERPTYEDLSFVIYFYDKYRYVVFIENTIGAGHGD